MKAAVVALVACASSACLVTSLQPVYQDDSIVFEEALLGQWENVDDRTSATIDRGEWRSYKVTYVNRSTTWAFAGNLTKMGDALFLDLTESRGADPGPYLVPVHGIYKIELGDDSLAAAPLEYGWFTQAMARRKLGRLTAALDGRRNVAISASTTELRAWLAHAPDGAFAAPMTFSRKR
jgi:hypothetical protein